jgi:hypothetical protein
LYLLHKENMFFALHIVTPLFVAWGVQAVPPPHAAAAIFGEVVDGPVTIISDVSFGQYKHDHAHAHVDASLAINLSTVTVCLPATVYAHASTATVTATVTATKTWTKVVTITNAASECLSKVLRRYV